LELLISALGIIFVFALIIFVHELGHFIMAKRSGVRVDDFAFGFPPRLWSTKKGDTRYSINLIPLGGYVKIYGDDGSDPDNPKSYAGKPAHTKIMILLAGVFLNFMLAWFILFGGYLFGMQPIIPGMDSHKGVVNNMKIIVSSIEKGSPAEKEGIQEGDIIKSIDGKEFKNTIGLISYIQNEANKDKSKDVTLNAVIERDGKTIEKKVTTYKTKQKAGNKKIEVNRIGVVLEADGKISAPFFTSLTASFSETVKIMYLTVLGVLDLFTKLITSFQVSENVAGPVGLIVITSSFAQMGLPALLQFTAILSVAVGVFNILPIPGLDGGHTLIVLIETAFRKKFSTKTKNIIQFAGFGALILLMAVVTFKDIFRFVIM